MLSKFFKKEQSDSSVESTKSWYADRYQTVVVQRNILLLITLLSLSGTIVSVLSITKITTERTIEPFVIEVEKRTGITNVVRPWQKDSYSKDEVLNFFHIMRYINARESYTMDSFKSNLELVQLMSTPKVYREYLSIYNDSEKRFHYLKLGQDGKREVQVKGDIRKLEGTKVDTIQVSYRVVQTGPVPLVEDKTVTIGYTLTDARYNKEQRSLNPLGFTVLNFAVANDR